jgi:hypothetical protein
MKFRILVLLSLSTLCVFADSFTWGNTYAQNWNNIGTGPYSAQGSGANANITIFCLDFNDEIGPPYNWNATVRNLNSSNVQTAAQYGGNYNNLLNSAYNVPGQQAPNQISGYPFTFVTDNTGNAYSVDLTDSSDAYTRYLEAAWLFSELETAGGTSQVGLVAQVAAWDLFVNAANEPLLASDIQVTNGLGNVFSFAGVTGLDFQQAVDYALTAAQTAVVTDHFDGAGWTLVTADPTWVEGAGNGIPAQEFLSPNAVPPVPEPGAMVLLATAVGLIGLGKLRRKHRRA